MDNIEKYDFNKKYPGDNIEKYIKGKIHIIPPNIEKGFLFGYSIFIPEEYESDTTLLVHCINTGGAGITDGKLDRTKPAITLSEGEAAAKLESLRGNELVWCSNDLKMPILTPLFPRIRGFYTHNLGSKIYNNDISYLRKLNREPSIYEKLTEEEINIIKEKCKDLPGQLVGMIEDAKNYLQTLGITVDSKVIIEGYSAGAKFANLFTALHPKIVKACIGGGTGGLGILPISEISNQKLKFPLGVADVPDFDLEAFKEVFHYYYIGEQDENDPAAIKSVEESGELIPLYPDCYTPHETTQIHTLLGKNIQERFNYNRKVYEQLGINAIFQKLYGNHITINQLQDINTGKYIVHENIISFIKKVSKVERKIEEPKKINY